MQGLVLLLHQELRVAPTMQMNFILHPQCRASLTAAIASLEVRLAAAWVE